MKKLYEYTLKASGLAKYQQRGVTKCPRCGRRFKVEQRVVSRISNGHAVLYHKECYEELFHK